PDTITYNIAACEDNPKKQQSIKELGEAKGGRTSKKIDVLEEVEYTKAHHHPQGIKMETKIETKEEEGIAEILEDEYMFGERGRKITQELLLKIIEEIECNHK
ncbi:15238_t:CDS:2, partial [Racocetra persica]